MNVTNYAGSIALNYAGARHIASYEVSNGVLTVTSPLGSAHTSLVDGESASASVARTLLRAIVEDPGERSAVLGNSS